MSKTVELGVIRRAMQKDGELGDPFISLDNKVKEVKLTMMLWDKDSKSEVETEVSLIPNEHGKFFINCNDTQDNVEFMLSEGYISQENAEKKLTVYNENNISRILTAKVELE